jgi:hypothetical protein
MAIVSFADQITELFFLEGRLHIFKWTDAGPTEVTIADYH